MSRVMRVVLVSVLCSLVVSVPSIWAYWIQDGIPLCTATAVQSNPTIISDGAGGAIVTWEDGRSGNWDIYAQRVGVSGNVLWTADGVALCTAEGHQRYPTITSDGSGGAIVSWRDDRNNGYFDIYAQRVDASGAIQWTADGVALCTAEGDQDEPTITSDGTGGAIVTWQDPRSGNYDIYVQRVNASGAVQWTPDGVALCTATGTQSDPNITSDGAGGAIITWQDYRGGDWDIYARRVNAAGVVQWTADGVPLCTATGIQSDPTIIADGAGGAIVTWQDYRGGNWDIYARQVDSTGAVQWTSDGVALCTAAGEQYLPAVTSDGAGGAIVTWYDERSGNYDIYAQRVDAAGDIQWTADGVALCTAVSLQWHPTITSDCSGGAIVTWEDYRSGTNLDIYAQRVDAAGTVQWTANGLALCTATGDSYLPTITSDGAGAAIVTWYDERIGSADIYAQLIDRHGRVCAIAPWILSIRDVPGDQGGRVRITIESSLLDDELESLYPISTYNIWQRIDDPSLLEMLAAEVIDISATGVMTEAPLKRSVELSSIRGWPLKAVGGRCFVSSRDMLGVGEFPPGTWELLGSFAACQKADYIYRAGTLADSTESGIPYSIYVVSAHTTTPSLWEVSEPDSGYSVDNLPPEPPEGLVAEQSFVPEGLTLAWDMNAANDLSHYAVYRGLSADFVPAPGNRIAAPLEPGYFDGEWRWDSGYYYKVSALDVHGNESGSALLRPEDVTGDEVPTVPEANYLSQNYPNPFNPVTRIEFGLTAPAKVSLRVYDASGRLVRVLVNEWREARVYSEIWDGADGGGRDLASGVYFYRLIAGQFTETKKMVLIQ